MIIQYNAASGRAYGPYLDNMRKLAGSANRLATGLRYANASDGIGQLQVADRMRLNIRSSQTILESMEFAASYSSTQDAILSQVNDILSRMTELATTASATTTSTTDRAAMDAEYKSLISEIQSLGSNNTKYNQVQLFNTALSIRTGVESTDKVHFSAVNLATFGTFTGSSVSTTTRASAAIASLRIKQGSLAILRTKSRTHNARIERSISRMETYISNISDAESAIRYVDIAQETGEFTKKQMLVNSGQAIIAQANNLVMSIQRFFS